MPIEIQVGPPVLTINQGDVFMVTDQRGEIHAEGEQGVFAGDTRFVSYYRLFINQDEWTLLNSSAVSYYAERVHLTNPTVLTEDGEIPERTLGLTVTRSIAHDIHEDFDVTNHSMRRVRFMLEVALRSDFADLFEVKAHKLVRRGHTLTRWHEDDGLLETTYRNQDFFRALKYQISNYDSRPHYANGRLYFQIDLQPGETWHSCASYALLRGMGMQEERQGCPRQAPGDQPFDHVQQEWLAIATRLISVNEEVYRSFRQSVEDIGALRLHAQDFSADVWMPAAGVPWFVAIFGRDSLIISLQNMIVHPALGLGTLQKLAEYQAAEMDDWRDAEPGKILHELRLGELAHFHKVPHTPYYGTWDATSLYLIALHESWKWLGDDSLLDKYRDVAERCLNWIDQHGDIDGDGFQEYQTRSSLGYENVGWKDAGDAVVYPDGSQVKQPKALCELQGYVYDAKRRFAEICRHLGDTSHADKLEQEAAQLYRRFNQAFWCDSIGTYAFGLDPHKRAIETVASNAGHCLWSGIVDPARAEPVVRRLMAEDMWSGWGIRTLSAANPAYNPYSYQLGSVWPHDNGIIAQGFKRYGFADEANRIARDIFEAASFFQSHRLPELYAGLPRQPGNFPVQYLGANIPQGWAAGAVFHLIQAILGLRGDAPSGKLYVHPTLPRWLPDVTLERLSVGPATLTLRFWREADGTSRWEIVQQEGAIAVVEEAWGP